VLEIY